MHRVVSTCGIYQDVTVRATSRHRELQQQHLCTVGRPCMPLTGACRRRADVVQTSIVWHAGACSDHFVTVKGLLQITIAYRQYIFIDPRSSVYKQWTTPLWPFVFLRRQCLYDFTSCTDCGCYYATNADFYYCAYMLRSCVVCLSVHLCRHCTQTAKHRITKQHHTISQGTVVFCCQKDRDEIPKGVNPTGRQIEVG